MTTIMPFLGQIPSAKGDLKDSQNTGDPHQADPSEMQTSFVALLLRLYSGGQDVVPLPLAAGQRPYATPAGTTVSASPASPQNGATQHAADGTFLTGQQGRPGAISFIGPGCTFVPAGPMSAAREQSAPPVLDPLMREMPQADRGKPVQAQFPLTGAPFSGEKRPFQDAQKTPAVIGQVLRTQGPDSVPPGPVHQAMPPAAPQNAASQAKASVVMPNAALEAKSPASQQSIVSSPPSAPVKANAAAGLSAVVAVSPGVRRDTASDGVRTGRDAGRKQEAEDAPGVVKATEDRIGQLRKGNEGTNDRAGGERFSEPGGMPVRLAAVPGQPVAGERAAADSAAVHLPLSPGMTASVVNQIVKGLVIRSSEKGTEARLVLEPESLGTVKLSIAVEDDKMVARINVANADVKSVVQANLPQLHEALAARGIDIRRIDVFSAEPGSGRDRGNGSGTGQKGSSGRRGNEDEEEVRQGRSLGYNTLEITV